MSEVKVGKNETIDSALRRFKRTCQKAGTLAEVRKREHYEKPSVSVRKNQKLHVNVNSKRNFAEVAKCLLKTS